MSERIRETLEGRTLCEHLHERMADAIPRIDGPMLQEQEGGQELDEYYQRQDCHDLQATIAV